MIATTTKICTTGRCTPARAEASSRPARYAYSTPRLPGASAGFEGHARAPSIFRADPLGRYVFTHFLADFDLQDHRPAVEMDRRLFWDRISVISGPFTPLPVHPESPFLLTKTGPLTVVVSRPGFARETRGSSPVRSSRIGRGRFGPGTSSRSLYRAKHFYLRLLS